MWKDTTMKMTEAQLATLADEAYGAAFELR
jgi:hypothetical protein